MSAAQLFLLGLVACLACGLGAALSMLFWAMIKDKSAFAGPSKLTLRESENHE
jgi:hypothetical protein